MSIKQSQAMGRALYDSADREADLTRRVAALKSILADRERELLAAKGPCSTKACRLHYAHSGPCDIARATP